MAITVTAPVWLWNSDRGSWHFLTIGGAEAAEIRLLSIGNRGGFGSVKVVARIGDTRWRTSLFPDRSSDSFVLPIKAEVRKRERIVAGDDAQVEIDVV